MNLSCLSCARSPWIFLATLTLGLVLGEGCSSGGSGGAATGGGEGTGGQQGTAGGLSGGAPSDGRAGGSGVLGTGDASGSGVPASGDANGSRGGAGGAAAGAGEASNSAGSKADGSVPDSAGADGNSPVDAKSDSGRDAFADAVPATTSYNPCPPSGTDCTIMPLGDSITDGFTVRGGYRIPFFQRAHQEGKQFTFAGSQVNGPATVDNVPFPQHHEGHSAHTIYDAPLAPIPRLGIARYVPQVIPQFHPDIVLLMIGTNDVDGNVDLPNAANRLGMLIDSIIALDSHSLIVVAQITPTMQDPLNQRIEAYNAGIPAVVKSRADAGKHVVLVDMYTAFVSDTAYKSKFLADRLHPNSTGYQVMSDIWNVVVHDLLR